MGLAAQNTAAADESVLVHTGDVFDDPDPPARLVDRVIDLFNRHTRGLDEGPRLLFIAGNHDTVDGETPALDRVVTETDAAYLTRQPTLVGTDDLALYGVDAHETEALVDGALTFEAPPAAVPAAVCLHATIGSGPTQRRVSRLPTQTSIPALNEMVPFRWTLVLCGHIHRPKYDIHGQTGRFYAGAPDRVRDNLTEPAPQTVNHFEITTRDGESTGTYDPVATRARPWIELKWTVGLETDPTAIADAVLSEWQAYVNETFPALDEEYVPTLEDTYVVPYEDTAIKGPTVDIELTATGDGVGTEFAAAVVDKLRTWGQAHAIKLTYEPRGELPQAVIGAGNVGRLGTPPSSVPRDY